MTQDQFNTPSAVSLYALHIYTKDKILRKLDKHFLAFSADVQKDEA